MNRRGRMVVLVVDDEPLIREVVAESLTEDGLDVAAAPSAEAALMLAQSNEEPEAVVTDVELGEGMNGLCLAKEVHRQWPQAGVVIMTGKASAVSGRRLAANEELLLKPFDPSSLVRAVRHVMRRSER